MIPGTEGGTEEEQGGDKAIATVVIVSGVGGEYSGVTVLYMYLTTACL